MKKCGFENLIDSYLLNRMPDREKEMFEEHYFNCSTCFEQLQERDELIAVIKQQGGAILEGESKAEQKRVFSFIEKIRGFLTPKQWMTVAVSAAALLLIVFGILPHLQKTTPQFYLNVNGEDVIRGTSISLISPVIDVSSSPSFFEWKSLGENIEYVLIIHNHQPLWTTTTKETRVEIPEEVKNMMKPGEKYSWQVKAFSPQGALIAVSSKVQFKIKEYEYENENRDGSD